MHARFCTGQPLRPISDRFWHLLSVPTSIWVIRSIYFTPCLRLADGRSRPTCHSRWVTKITYFLLRLLFAGAIWRMDCPFLRRFFLKSEAAVIASRRGLARRRSNLPMQSPNCVRRFRANKFASTGKERRSRNDSWQCFRISKKAVCSSGRSLY